jgi:WD40 repeat protein
MGASDRGIRLWDIASGNQVLETTSLADGYLTPDSKHILSHKWEKTVYIVEVATGKESPKFEVPEPTTGLALSPDGKQVALNHSDGTIRLWEYDTGKEIRKLNGRAGPGAVLFSANGKQLLSGGGDKGTAGDRIIRLWDVETGQLIRTFEDFKGVSSWEGHDVVVHCFFLPGERRVAASAWGKDSRLVIWDAATGEMIKEHDLGADFHKAVAVSPGGQWFATAHEDRDRTIRLRDLATGAELLRLTMPEVRIPRGLSFSPDGRYLAAGSYRGWVYVWQLWK